MGSCFIPSTRSNVTFISLVFTDTTSLGGTTQGGITAASTEGGMLITNSNEGTTNYVSRHIAPYFTAATAKRLNTVLKIDITAGVAFLPAKDQFTVLYLPTEAFGSNETDSVLMGTISNRPTHARIKVVDKDILKNIYVLANKEDVPSQIPIGNVIDKTNEHLKGYFHDNDGNPLDDKEKVIARVPVALPIPYGINLPTGKFSGDNIQGVYDSLEDINAPLLPFWLKCVLNHDEDLQEALADASLSQYCPALPALGHGITTSPFIQLKDYSDNDQDLCEEAERHQSKLNGIARGSIQSVTSGPNHQNSPQPPPGTIQTTSAVAQQETVTHDDKQNLQARVLSFGLKYDPETGRVSLPELSEFFGALRDATTKANQRETVQSLLVSLEDALADESHFLARATNLPKLDKVTLAYLAQALFSSNPVDSLSVDQATGFVGLMLMPDSHETAQAKSDYDAIFAAEEAMGEDATKRSTLPTTFKSVNELTGISTLLGTFANFVVMNMMYFKFDLANPASMPDIVRYTLNLALLITSRPARQWLIKNGDKRIMFMYYVLNQMLAIMTACSRNSNDMMIRAKLLAGSTDSIPPKNLELMYNIYKDTVQTIEQVLLNSCGVPNTVLWTNSTIKQKMDERDRKKFLAGLETKPPGGGKRTPDERPGGGGGPPANKRLRQSNPGYIVCSGDSLNLPGVVFNADFKLCKAWVREGAVCQQGNQCKKHHLTLNELPEDKARALVQHVNNDRNLKFVNVDEELLKKLSS
jgi:hypothetical protein